MHEILEPVALTRDIPVAGLRCGDIGAVVEVHEADAYEVEFVVASGRTQALLTLSGSDVRSLGDQDLLSARSVSRRIGAKGSEAARK